MTARHRRTNCLLPIMSGVLSAMILFPAGAKGDKVLRIEEGDTLEEMRYKIDRNGWKFTVDHNRVYDSPPEIQRQLCGLHPSAPGGPPEVSTDIGPLARRLGKADLPSRFDWRDYEGRSYIGPIRDQEDCGSCYSFGACAAAEGTYNWALGLYDQNCSDFSESYIIWCLGEYGPYRDHFHGCEGADADYYESKQ
ncbi:MAG: C1 family peptidase [PVC group bacterium]